MHAEITPKILQQELEEVNNWYGLGIALSIPAYQLDKIGMDATDTDERKYAMFERWEKQKPRTWLDLLKALITIEERSLAERINKKYGMSVSLE